MNEGVQGVLAPDFVGVLDTNLSVAVEDISRSGCLLETRSTIPVGDSRWGRTALCRRRVSAAGTPWPELVAVVCGVIGEGLRFALAVQRMRVMRGLRHGFDADVGGRLTTKW